MTTRRNNMFYARGASSAYSSIIQILKEFKSDEERIAMFEKLQQSWLKCANEYTNGIHNTEIDSVTVFTNTYYVTVKNGHYELVDDKIDGESFDGIIFWNKHIKTNYIIELTGDFDIVTEFVDNDEIFTDNIAKLIGCVPDVNDVEDLTSLGLPEDFDIIDVFNNPEKYNLPKGAYDDLDAHYDQYDITHFKSWALRQRVLYDYCKANGIKLPYLEKPKEQRPVSDRQSEEMITGNLKDLHKYIKSVNFSVGDKFFLGYINGDESPLLENIRKCISYFDKYSIPTKFEKVDYSYANSNHQGKTQFTSCYKLTDLKSLYALVSKVSKKVKFSTTFKAWMKENNISKETSILPVKRNLLMTDDQIISDKILTSEINNYKKQIESISSDIISHLPNEIFIGSKKSDIKKYDTAYLKRYVFNIPLKKIPKIVEERELNDKDVSNISDFLNDISMEIKPITNSSKNNESLGYEGNNTLIPVFSVKKKTVYI